MNDTRAIYQFRIICDLFVVYQLIYHGIGWRAAIEKSGVRQDRTNFRSRGRAVPESAFYTIIWSGVQISVNVNVDLSEGAWLFIKVSCGESFSIWERSLVPILPKKSLKDSAIDLSSETTTSSAISSLILMRVFFLSPKGYLLGLLWGGKSPKIALNRGLKLSNFS
jgi:hypothetical protein